MPTNPNSEQLKTMDYACQAQPFVEVIAKPAIKTTEFVLQAQPFYVTQTDGISNFMVFF